MSAPEVCPNCGGDVPRGAKACPECGSDEQTGWSNEAHASGLDLPDPEFHYQDFIDREFGRASPVPRGVTWFWWVAAVALLIAFALFWIRW